MGHTEDRKTVHLIVRNPKRSRDLGMENRAPCRLDECSDFWAQTYTDFLWVGQSLT